MTRDVHESPEFVRLFQTYTGSHESIGARLTATAEQAHAGAPLIVATSSDLALYPGNGQAAHHRRLPPLDARLPGAGGDLTPRPRGRHAGPDEGDRPARAVGRQLPGAPGRRPRRTRGELAGAVGRADRRSPTFAGREQAIAEMVDYACRATERFLERALKDDDYLAAANVRRDYLDGPSDDLPVPVNRIMVATFFLFGMDLAHRLINWFDGLDLPWEQTMVLIAGRQGRPTAGVTRDSNSVAGVIHAASRGRLPDGHLLIAPHAPGLPDVRRHRHHGGRRARARLPAALGRGAARPASSASRCSRATRGSSRRGPRRRAITPGTADRQRDARHGRPRRTGSR